MPDPILKTAAAEIEAVLKKHDCAGIVMLASQTHMEYLLKIDPSWSCCWVEEAEGGKVLRVRSRRDEYPDKAAQKKVMEDSTGMILGFVDVARDTMTNLERVAAMIGAKMDISHWTRKEPPTIPPQ